MSELPAGWTALPLGEAGEWRGGGTPSKAQDAFWREGSIPWVSPKDMKRDIIDDAEDHITEAALDESATQLIPARSALIVTRSGILRHSLPVAVTARDVAINQDIKALIPAEGINAEFVANQLRADTQLILSGCAKSGTTVDSVDFDRLKAWRIRLAPFAEQRRIVAKLDSLFARTKAARAELARIPPLIEHCKQAILEKAFTGELTADWRRDKARVDGEPWNLPKTWSWGRFHDIAEVACNLVSPLEALDLPHIAPNHLQSGIPRLLPYQTVREDKVRSAKHRFYPGQVIYSKIRPYLRKAVLATFDGVCSADMYPLNAKGDPYFLLYWLLSPGFNDLALAHQGRVVLPKINQTALYSIPTPLPPLEEQTEIGKRISRAMTWIDAIAAEQFKASGLLKELDAAVLSKAFRGELVPQNPNDEPAEKLLERIRAARGEKSKSRRSPTPRA